MSHRILAIIIVLALVLPIAACGKKGPLELPPGQTDQFPKTYPRH